eukprot:5480233-Prorocentrum_lima.AAC.1
MQATHARTRVPTSTPPHGYGAWAHVVVAKSVGAADGMRLCGTVMFGNGAPLARRGGGGAGAR